MPHHTKNRTRSGAAVTETAIVLPIILLLISATIEISSAIYLKETLTVSAYEGARMAVQRKATDQDVITKTREILRRRQIDFGGNNIRQLVTISPAVDRVETLEPITVTVRAPTKDNLILPFSWLRLFSVDELEASVTMLKEYTAENNN